MKGGNASLEAFMPNSPCIHRSPYVCIFESRSYLDGADWALRPDVETTGWGISIDCAIQQEKRPGNLTEGIGILVGRVSCNSQLQELRRFEAKVEGPLTQVLKTGSTL